MTDDLEFKRPYTIVVNYSGIDVVFNNIIAYDSLSAIQFIFSRIQFIPRTNIDELLDTLEKSRNSVIVDTIRVFGDNPLFPLYVYNIMLDQDGKLFIIVNDTIMYMEERNEEISAKT